MAAASRARVSLAAAAAAAEASVTAPEAALEGCGGCGASGEADGGEPAMAGAAENAHTGKISGLVRKETLDS